MKMDVLLLKMLSVLSLPPLNILICTPPPHPEYIKSKNPSSIKIYFCLINNPVCTQSTWQGSWFVVTIVIIIFICHHFTINSRSTYLRYSSCILSATTIVLTSDGFKLIPLIVLLKVVFTTISSHHMMQLELWDTQ